MRSKKAKDNPSGRQGEPAKVERQAHAERKRTTAMARRASSTPNINQLKQLLEEEELEPEMQLLESDSEQRGESDPRATPKNRKPKVRVELEQE